jgi:hypothetical protein
MWGGRRLSSLHKWTVKQGWSAEMKWNVPRRFIHAFLPVVLVLSLSACATSLKWAEDVKLPDGRIVTLTRYQEFRGVHELFQPRTPSDFWLEFRNPDNKERVRWNGKRDLTTVALLVEQGTPQLLMRLWFGGVEKWRCPDPPYLLFRYEAGKWTQTPLGELRGRKIRPNMTDSPPDAKADILSHNKHLDWQLAGHVSDALEPVAYIDFTNLGTQTFGIRCNPPFNMMEVKRGRQ